jgi:hypothetical protein
VSDTSNVTLLPGTQPPAMPGPPPSPEVLSLRDAAGTVREKPPFASASRATALLLADLLDVIADRHAGCAGTCACGNTAGFAVRLARALLGGERD